MNYLSSVSHSSWMGSVSDGSPVGVSSALDAARAGRGSSLELIDRRALDALRRIWLRNVAGSERQASTPTALLRQAAPANP